MTEETFDGNVHTFMEGVRIWFETTDDGVTMVFSCRDQPGGFIKSCVFPQGTSISPGGADGLEFLRIKCPTPVLESHVRLQANTGADVFIDYTPDEAIKVGKILIAKGEKKLGKTESKKKFWFTRR